MRYLIVDGHSVIFAWPELRKLHTRRTGLARDELVKLLTEYQDASGVRVVAVFDGKGGKANEATEPGGIQVFYSAAGQTADEIVERLVAKYAGEHEIMVATSDHLEQQTATTFGALVVSAEGLRAWIEDAQRDLARRLKQHRRK
jgi:predicted RNA-binding protein with PIN domain